MAEAMGTPAQVMRVSNVELFFELIFVFAITQLTLLVERARDPLDYLRTLLVLILIWWMYAGYVWLTNAAGVDARMRLVLIAGMGGFLLMGASVPQVYGTGGLAFGLAYLYVVVLHLVAFRVQAGKAVSRAVLLLAPFNLGAATLVIAGSLIQADWAWLFFAAAVTPFVLATLSGRERGFPMKPGHFVDRHAGVMIIALGETVVGIGSGAAGQNLDAQTIAAVALSLAFIAAIWWVYFSRDHERAETALEAAHPDDRARMAVRAYWYPFIGMLFGVVLIATGIQHIVAHPNDPAGDSAWLVASGIGLYLLGSALFGWVVRIRKGPSRVASAGVAVVIGGAAAGLPGLPFLAGAAGLAMIMIAIEARTEKRREDGS